MSFLSNSTQSEIILSTSNDKTQPMYAWDIRSGAIISNFKQSSSTNQSTTFINFKQSIHSAIILSASSQQPLLTLFSWHKEHSFAKYIIPEKLQSLQVSPCQCFMVGGGLSGRIYLWDIKSGLLMKQFDAHLGRVNCLRFTVDSRQFVSCGDDSMVLLWNMQQLLDLNLPTCTPQATLPSHRLSVTYIQTTISNQLFTCSLDRTVKIWDLTTQTLLCTLVFPGQITAMVVDQAEQVLICGLETGLVNAVDKDNSGFIGHSKKINSLSLNFDGGLLVSGSDDGTCIVWDLDSKQALRTFTHHTGTNQTLSLPWFHRHQGPVTSVACLIKPPHIQNPDFPALNLPCVGVLQRYLTTNAAVFGELENNVDMIEEKSADNERNSFKIDKLKEKIDDLMIENAKLKEFNGALYQKCVDKFMNVE